MGVAVLFHPFYDIVEPLGFGHERGAVKGRPGRPNGDVVTPQPLFLEVVDDSKIGGGELGEAGNRVGEWWPRVASDVNILLYPVNSGGLSPQSEHSFTRQVSRRWFEKPHNVHIVSFG